MTKKEIEQFTELSMPERGNPPCLLCKEPLVAGERVVLVPMNCDETEKMQAGDSYEGQFTHYKCVEKVP